MGVSAGAAEAAVKAQHGDESGAAAESRRGAFAGRRVSVPSEQPGSLAPGASREAGATFGASIQQPGHRSRVVTAPACSTNAQGTVAAPLSGPEAGTSEGVAQAVKSEPASRPPAPPWLNPHRNAVLEKTDRLLLELGGSAQVAEKLREDLSAVLYDVQYIEGETLRAHELLKKSRTEELSDAESRKLYYIHRWQRSTLPERQAELDARIRRLRESGGFDPADARLVEELQQRFDDAHDYWRRIGLPWLGGARRVDSRLPLSGNRPVGIDAQAAAARLALVGHIMGETPLLNCAKGPDFTARLDSHVKLLATAADCDHGNLPTVEMEKTPAWRAALSDFAPP